MKLMSIDRAIRDEQMKNDAVLKAVKAGAEKKTLWTIIISILGILGGLIGIIFGKSFWPKIKFNANAEVK